MRVLFSTQSGAALCFVRPRKLHPLVHSPLRFLKSGNSTARKITLFSPLSLKPTSEFLTQRLGECGNTGVSKHCKMKKSLKAAGGEANLNFFRLIWIVGGRLCSFCGKRYCINKDSLTCYRSVPRQSGPPARGGVGRGGIIRHMESSDSRF